MEKNHKRIVLSFLLLLLTVCSAGAVDFEGSKWISVSEDQFAPNQWICFRKSFDLKKQETDARFYMAVDSKYWLWVNGEMVVFEGGLKRGPNPDDTYYDVIDISTYLKKGKNTIAVLMWYWGKDGYCHKNSGKPGLLAKLALNKTQIVSDGTWKVKIHPAYGATSAPFPNYRLPESNIQFDARKDIPGWEQPSFSDATWDVAQELGVYPCSPWNKLHERPFPNWYDTGIVDYESVERIENGDSLIIKAKLPRNISVTPYIRLKSTAGKLIDIRTDNYKGGSEYNVRAEYITKDGEQEFEAFNYANGHYMLYTLPKGTELIKVAYRETRFNTVYVGKFECNDTFYNRLWTKAHNTMNLNMRDAIQDADRERSQWWGDAVIVAGEIFYSCDQNGWKAVNKAIRNLVDWRKPDGILYSPVPAGSWDKELPAQMLAGIGKFGFWNYYLYTGDKTLIEYVYPHVKKYLSLWTLDQKGLVNHRAGGWDWLDWGNNIDAPVLENAWYCLALESASNMAQLLGYTDEAKVYIQTKEKIKQAVNTCLWNGQEYRSPDYTGKTDDRGNGLAVLAGFTDANQWNKIRNFLNGYANASPYMEKYILESYFRQGDAEGGLARMKNRYRYMVDHEFTTLWEDWQIGGSGGGSINHGWAGGPLTLLSQYVAGIAPVEPGWKTFIIKPQLGHLKWVNCIVPAGDKTIDVALKKSANRFDMQVKTTLKSDYIVAVPMTPGTTGIEINDKKYRIEDLNQLKEIKMEGRDADYIYLKTGLQQLTVSVEQAIQEPYPPVSGSFSDVKVPQSPDPLVAYRWTNPQADDDLEIYTLSPVNMQVDKPENAIVNTSSIHVTGACNLMFDFGQVNAAWLEFDSENLSGEIEASISEFGELSYKTARPVRYGNVWRLELNKELYEGVRFAWIHIRKLDQPADISSVRLVCQIKPTNYEGSFSCSDTLLTRSWYTGAYDVKLNLLKDYFGAILMNRGDRFSWTGDAHVSQAASMVAFGNYDFVKTNLRFTSNQSNGIASYALYWVLSLIDYFNYTGDKALLEEMLTNACAKLDTAYNHYGRNPHLDFYGWDERLGAGFENCNCPESQNAYKMLSIRAWNEFGATMEQAGYPQLAAKYKQYAVEKITELRKDVAWTKPLGVHAAADAVSAGFMNAQEQKSIWQTAFSDRLQRVSYSPFNQYFIIGSLAKMQRHAEALTTIDDCWGEQIRYGATTFFEVFRPSWNRISKPNESPVNNQCGATSLTHPWSAGITKWLSEEVLGVKPTAPGFATFIIQPHLSAAVTWVKGSVPTLHGTISASFDLITGDLEATVPAGTSATLAIPKAGRSIRSVKFAEPKNFKKSEDKDYIYYFALPEGHYLIKVNYAGKLPEIVKEPLIYAGGSTVKEDVSTQGNWKGKYGSKGYVLYDYDGKNNHRMQLPDFISPLKYAHPAPYYRPDHTQWVSATTDVRALESNDKTETFRNLGAIFCNLTFAIDIPCPEKRPYKLSLYFADWDSKGRRSAIEVFDMETKNLLMPVYMVRDYVGGKYVTFEVDRSVRIRINQVRGDNAVLSGIFFD